MTNYVTPVLLPLLFTLITIGGFAQSRSRILIITGNGNSTAVNEKYPPWTHEFQNEKVVSILQDNMAVDVDVHEDLSILDPGRLRAYDLIISNSIFLTPTERQLDALHGFVSQGKPFLTLHAGILSFLNWDRYADFMGGVFIGGPSSEPATFKVYTTNTEFWGYEYAFRDQSEHPVSAVVENFFTRDELYYFQPVTKNFHVIARAENHPVMWWHPYHEGKVMNLSLGHDEAAKDNKGYQDLLTNGVRWLLGIPLLRADPPEIKVVSNRQVKYDDLITVETTSSANPGNITFSSETDDSQDLFSVSCDQAGKVSIELTGKAGEASFAVTARRGDLLIGRKAFNLKVAEDGTGNLAAYFGNTVTVSSCENESEVFQPRNLIDNDPSTRWSSARAETASVTVDLRKSYPVSRIILNWEASYAAEYHISYSETGEDWSDLTHVENGDGGEDLIQVEPVHARFIRIEGLCRAPEKWGYSLYDIGIYCCP